MSIELLSCAEETIVHDFLTLDDIQSIKHTNDEPNDFYFFGGGRHFLHYNQCDLKLYTFRANEFRSIRKYRRIPKEFTCFACVKTTEPLFVAGTESGKINFYNCLKPTLDVQKSFPSSGSNKVVDLDYSYCNKYLSALYDDGRINIFGLQTSVKLNELPVEARHIPMVARFFTSPNIKLAVGSYTGRFTVHDLVAKTKIFESTAAHKDFCCDIICPLSHQNLIISAGDCTINIYDLRKKKRIKDQELLYPLSTISLSHCGTYIAAGDKAGEISCFDIRKMKLPLVSKRISRRQITRVAFIPPLNETVMCPINEIELCESESCENSLEVRGAVNENENPDSFFDFGHANPRMSDVLSDSNFSMRMNRYTVDFESMSMAGYKTRDILTEVSNHQPEHLNTSFVTHRRKTNFRKSVALAHTTLISDVIKEESEMSDNFKTKPTTPLKNKSLNSAEHNKFNSKLAALEGNMADAKGNIDELKLNLAALHVDLHSLTGVVMRSCAKRETDPEINLGTKLQLIDYLGHGEQFQEEYYEMVEERQRDTMWIQKILHPRMFQD